MINTNYLNYLNKYYPNQVEVYRKCKGPVEYIVDEFTNNTENEYINKICQKDQLIKKYLEKYIQDRTSKSKLPLFNKIEIETINQCNNNCGFCPVNRDSNPKEPEQMSLTLYYSIINQLKILNYSGAIGLFSNNEPLLDDRFLELLEYAYTKLPNSYLYFYTNGMLLTEKNLKSLLGYTDFIHINNYSNNKHMIAPIRKVHKLLREQGIQSNKVEIHLRNKHECLSNRGGQSPNRTHSVNIQLNSPCILPFSQMVVRTNGQVSLCCNDSYGKYTMGDLNKQSIEEVWYGEQFNIFREQSIAGRAQGFICKNCDMLFMPLAFEDYLENQF